VTGTAVEFVRTLLGIFVLALLVILVLSPFESLQWWAGWVGEDAGSDKSDPIQPSVAPLDDGRLPVSAPAQYVILLTGVGALGTDVDPWEQRLVDLLQQGLQRGVVLAGLFPFSVRRDTLIEKRRTAWIWRRLGRLREERPSLAARLIDWRNLTQVFVSMDPRYGPIYNKGVEEKVAAALQNLGYGVGSGVPIILIGYSGGAQIALGVTLYLARDLQAPVSVISLGGVLGDDPSLESIKHLQHLWGDDDLEARMAMAVVPARWPISKRSRWNVAIAAKRVEQTGLGPMAHTGPKGYLDPDVHVPDGRSHLQVTASTMLEIIDAWSGGSAR
jgi:hypothetical protein